MTSQKIASIYGVIKRPNNTFREIFEDGNYYFKPSVIILILSSFFTVSFTILSGSISDIPTNELGYFLDAEIQIIDSVVNILGGFLIVVLIFYVGRMFRGSKNFRGVFSVASYSLIPILIGGILVSIFLYYPPLLEYISGIDSGDSRFLTLFWVMYFVILFPCSIWTLILTVKAIKIANNFGTAKAFGIVVLALIISNVIWLSFFELNPINHPYFG